MTTKRKAKKLKARPITAEASDLMKELASKMGRAHVFGVGVAPHDPEKRIIHFNGRAVDMTTNASTLNSLVDLQGPPPSAFIPEMEQIYEVKWDAKTNRFTDVPKGKP